MRAPSRTARPSFCSGAGLPHAVHCRARATPAECFASTTIGYGSHKEGTEEVHGSPLGDEDLKNVSPARPPSRRGCAPTAVRCA
jgi:hypothetical protein